MVPVKHANRLYRKWLEWWANKPKRDGGKRKLGNMGVHVPADEMTKYKVAWLLLKQPPA